MPSRDTKFDSVKRALWVDESRCGDTDCDDQLAFFQKRLSMFGLCVFVLEGGSWAVLAAASLLPFSQGANPHPPISISRSSSVSSRSRSIGGRRLR